VFRPIRFKDNGFCSKECYEASKIKVVPVVEIKEEILTEDVKPINEEAPIAIEVEEISLIEDSVIETTTVVEPTIKKETNTYKKKKSKN
jgi:hypothetical protein